MRLVGQPFGRKSTMPTTLDLLLKFWQNYSDFQLGNLKYKVYFVLIADLVVQNNGSKQYNGQ